jgi:hypothetical protein
LGASNEERAGKKQTNEIKWAFLSLFFFSLNHLFLGQKGPEGRARRVISARHANVRVYSIIFSRSTVY